MNEVRGVVVAHGSLAQALIDAVARIVGGDHGLIPVSNEGCDRGALEDRVASAVEAGPAVVFVDMPTGSCSFAVMRRFRLVPEVAIVTGVNLAMLIEFAFHRSLAPEDLAARVAEVGRSAVGVQP